MQMNIYRFHDYREAVSALIADKREHDTNVSASGLADAIRVQKTYVSRVLNGKADFSADQLYATCDYLELSEEERDYLLLLLEYLRSEHPRRKKNLLGEINRLQTEQKNIRKVLSPKFIEPGDDSAYQEYYLNPYVPLVHMFLTLPKYQNNIKLIGKALNINEFNLNIIFSTLQKLGIIDKTKNGHYEVRIKHLFLPKDSTLQLPSDLLGRHLALQHLRMVPKDRRVVFSLTFTADEKARARIHEEFLRFLRSAEGLIKDAPSEGVFRLDFDMFQWDFESN